MFQVVARRPRGALPPCSTAHIAQKNAVGLVLRPVFPAHLCAALIEKTFEGR
jgi:hypothetical protein